MRARDNPFVTARLHQLRYRFASGFNLEALWQKLAAMNCRGALVGPEGSGKTTLLENLDPVLAGQGLIPFWLRLNCEQRNLPADSWHELRSHVTSRHIILLDGAEQLARREWRQLLETTAHVGGLVITAHQPGLLRTLWQCETTPELLGTLAGELLDGTGLDANLPLTEMFHRHSGNIRTAFLELYDRFAAL